MYVRPNFKTKKAFKEAVKLGDKIELYDPSPFGIAVTNGTAFVEGPHKWYASVTVVDSKIIKVS